MGVKQMESYLLRHHASSCPRERISDLVRKYREETGSEFVEAVVDANYLHREIMRGLESVTGGDFREYENEVLVYIKRFTDLGITPVFFLDGCVENGKRRCWLDRKRDSYRIIENVYYDITNGSKPFIDQILPPGIYESTVCVLKESGFKVVTTEGDADQEMAKYARDHNSFCILSRDTDFVILRGARYYLSVFHKHLRVRDMSTIHFDRNAIAKSLRLNPVDLPLLAAMLPSDIVDGRYLVPLHRKLLNSRSRDWSAGDRCDMEYLVPELVQVIRNGLWKHPDPVSAILDLAFNGWSPFLLRRLAEEVIGEGARPTELREGLKEQITCCLRMFEFGPVLPVSDFPLKLELEIDAEVFELARERHSKCVFMQSSLMTILTNRMFEMAPCLEDRLLPPSCTTAKALLPFRRRLYGLLQASGPRGPVLEWYPPAMHPEDPFQPAIVEPEYPGAISHPHPGLAALWTSHDETVDSARWRLLAWALAAHRDPELPVDALADDLRALPVGLVVPAAMLCILYHSGALHDLGRPSREVVRTLARAVVLSKRMSTEELRRVNVGRYSDRAVHLAAVFMRTYTLITLLFDVLGGPVPREELWPSKLFNGKVFHNIFIDELDVSSQCDQDLLMEDRLVLFTCREVDVRLHEE